MQPRSLIHRTFLLLWTLSLLASVAFLGAQETEDLQTNEDGFFIDTVDVNVVNVEVFVTDKKGNRILGLDRDDFTLEVDKKPVMITNFYAVEAGVARGDGLESLPPPPPELPGRKVSRAEQVPDEQRLSLVVYVDNLHLHPFTRNKAFRFIRSFLRERMSPGDQVMLVTYERSLHERVPFTTDPELVVSATYELETHSGLRVHFDSERKDILDQIYEADDIYTVQGRATQYAESVYNDMSFAIKSIDSIVESLAGLPGRKAVLYVSDGMSMRPGEDVFYALNDRTQGGGGRGGATGGNRGISGGSVLMEIHRFDLTRDFQRITSKANANRVTFYTLDAAGLRTYSYMDASNQSANGGAFIDQVHFSNLQHPLIFMAQETGGMSILNTNDFTKGLNRMGNDFQSYYSLGFSSGTAESGRYHRVQVKLKEKFKGKKYVVRHREGYRDKPVSTRMTEGTLASLHYGARSNTFGAELVFGEATPHGNRGRRFLVQVSVRIPIGKLSFLPQPEFQRGRIRLYVAARDSEGGLSPVQDIPVPIDIPTDKFEHAQGQFYQYDMTLEMRRGRQIVAVGIHDEIGAETGYVARGLSVGGGR